MVIDLSKMQSIRKFVDEFLAANLPLHYLINNAGVYGPPPEDLTAEGFQMTMGTNHIGPMYLTELLLPKLRESTPSRVVFVSSKLHGNADITIENLQQKFRPAESIGAFTSYANSKLCNILYAKTLDRRLIGSGVTVYSLHPGLVATEIGRDDYLVRFYMGLISCFSLSPVQGASTTIYCVVGPGLESLSGGYFECCAPASPSNKAKDDQLAQAIINYSQLQIDQAVQRGNFKPN